MAQWPRSKTAEERAKLAKPSYDWLGDIKPTPQVEDPLLDAEARVTSRKIVAEPKEVEPLEGLAAVRASFYAAVPGARTPFDYLDELDRRLVAAGGWPETSEWWKAALGRFYSSSCVQFVVRVGRRGGKSSSLCRVAVLEALMGEYEVAPGDTATVAIISVDTREAKDRIVTIDAILGVLGVKCKTLTERIDLADAPIAFRVFTATISGVSGFSGICVICDEVAKWKDSKERANPAEAVLASVRPTMAGLPHARIFLLSSPWKRRDAHARAFAEGDTAFQRVAFAETWVARPALTIDDTRRLAPTSREWEREYAAIPMEDEPDGLFTATMLDAVTRSTRELPRDPSVRQYVAAMGAYLARNTWTLVIAGRRRDEKRVRRSIVACREWRSDVPLDPSTILPQIRSLCASYGVSEVYSDAAGAPYRDHPARDGLAIHVLPQPRMLESAMAMLARVCDGEDELPPDPLLREDLLSLCLDATPLGWSLQLPNIDEPRRADFALPAMLALDRCLVDPVMAERPRSEAEYWAQDEAACQARDLQRYGGGGGDWLEKMADDFNGG